RERQLWLFAPGGSVHWGHRCRPAGAALPVVARIVGELEVRAGRRPCLAGLGDIHEGVEPLGPSQDVTWNGQACQLSPSFFSRLTSVLRATPRARAASALLPPAAASARTSC